MMHLKRLNTSGQAMLIAVGLGLMLVIALAAVLFMNQIGAMHQTDSSRAVKGESLAEEGISYAIQQLSTASAWSNALNGDFTGTDCNTNANVMSPSGKPFRLYCSTGTAGNPNLQSYQVSVVAVGRGIVKGTETPLKALKAYVSQRKAGTELPSGVQADAALLMVRQPAVSGTVDVHWGSVISYESGSVWSLNGTMDTARYPRKFSAGGFTASASTFTRSGNALGGGPNSDQKEFWAYSSMTLPPVVDEDSYITLAKAETGITAPTSLLNGGSLVASNCDTGNSCGYFTSPNFQVGDTAVFGGNYTAPAGSVIYVNGGARFNQVSLDQVTFIVNGPLTVTSNAGGGQPNVHVPINASLEYPYSPTSWPCNGSAGANCSFASAFSGSLQFRGFLFVKGNFTVAANPWTMAGTLVVGDFLAVPGTSGKLIVPTGTALTVLYDDTINHAILVKPDGAGRIRIVVDQIQSISAF